MVQELEYDPDKDFLLDVICTAFKRLPQDSLLQPAEMHNYHFTVNAEARSEVKNIIKAEMYEGNYQGVIQANFDNAQRYWVREIWRPKNK